MVPAKCNLAVITIAMMGVETQRNICTTIFHVSNL